MCIPVREVVSFQFFDQDLYEQFQSGIGQARAEGQDADSEGGGGDERRVEETRAARFADDADERGPKGGGR